MAAGSTQKGTLGWRWGHPETLRCPAWTLFLSRIHRHADCGWLDPRKRLQKPMSAEEGWAWMQGYDCICYVDEGL